MIICEACGCPVDPDYLQIHSDWHDDLVTRSDLAKNAKLANSKRITYESYIQDC